MPYLIGCIGIIAGFIALLFLIGMFTYLASLIF